MHDARIEDAPDTRRSTTENVSSSGKRSNDSVVRAREQYREFREIALTCTGYNVERCMNR